MNYVYKTEPYAHQRKIFEDSCERPYVGLFMDMGTGKTKVCIDTMAYLWREKRLSHVLILAPKGVYRNWLLREIPKHMPDDVPLYIVTWSSGMNVAEKRKLDEMPLSKHDDKLRILIMNIEALSSERGGSRAISYCKFAPKLMVIVDESTTIKNPGAKRTKIAIIAAAKAQFRRLCSGLPTPQGPLDMFSQLKWLDPYCLPSQSFYAFRARYATLKDMYFGARRFKKVTGFQRLDELHGIMERVGYRLRREDCLDLPPKIYQNWEVEMTPEQESAYERLCADTMVLINREKATGILTAPLMITRLLRLHQIVCGHIVDDEGTIYDLPTNRLEALVDVLDGMTPPVIVWANYRHDIRRIVKRLGEVYGPERVASYFGETTEPERDKALMGFYEGRINYLVGNPQTGGYGLSLTRSSNVVYYSNSYNLEHRAQSEDRVHRIGQTKHVTYVDLVTPNTVDEKILKALRDKETLAKLLLDQGAEFFRQ